VDFCIVKKLNLYKIARVYNICIEMKFIGKANQQKQQQEKAIFLMLFVIAFGEKKRRFLFFAAFYT
jgi:hypothetical protein